MKKFLVLLLCLSLSFFILTRAAMPNHTPAPDTKTDQEEPTGQEADANPLLKDANTDEEVASGDDDSGEGEDMNDDDGATASGDEDTAGDDGGDDGGGEEGE
jgi:hypothetical protein